MDDFWNACCRVRLIVTNVYSIAPNAPLDAEADVRNMSTAQSNLTSLSASKDNGAIQNAKQVLIPAEDSVAKHAVDGYLSSFRVRFEDETEWGEVLDTFILHREAYHTASVEVDNLLSANKDPEQSCYYFLGGSSGMGKTLWGQWQIVRLTKKALANSLAPPVFVYQTKHDVYRLYIDDEGHPATSLYPYIQPALSLGSPDYLICDTLSYQRMNCAKRLQIFISGQDEFQTLSYSGWHAQILRCLAMCRILNPFTFEEYAHCEGQLVDGVYVNHQSMAFRYHILGGCGRFLRQRGSAVVTQAAVEKYEKLISEYFQDFHSYPFPDDRDAITTKCAKILALEVGMSKVDSPIFEHLTAKDPTQPFLVATVPASAVLKCIQDCLRNEQKLKRTSDGDGSN